MNRKFLEDMGLTKEQIDSILNENSRDIGAVKSKFGDYDTVKAQLAEANTTIEGYKSMDIDGIRASADAWKTKAETAERDAAAKLAQLQFDHAVNTALQGAKARNTTAVRALLQSDKLKLAGDEVIGLKEQLEALRGDASTAFLFEADTPSRTGIRHGTPPEGDNSTQANDALRALFGKD